MEPRYQLRQDRLLADCQVPATRSRGLISRLESFAPPFVASLPGPEGRTHSRTYLAGLLSDVERKDAESIAYRYGLDRQTIPRSIGEGDGDHSPRIEGLARQVADPIGRADAVLVFDPSGFPRKGTASVGVQRQWCGRPGEVEGCQVGVFLGPVSDEAHALVAFRLHLPKAWARDRQRRKMAGVPEEIKDRTRHGLALVMRRRHGGVLPHGGVAGDDAMGRPARFRPRSARDGERYRPALPANPTARDREEPPPPYGGPGRHPEAPSRRAQAWCAASPAQARTRPTARDGENGPLEVEIVARRAESKIDRRVVGFEEALVVVRDTDGGVLEHDYHLSDAAPGTPSVELARVAKAEHRIEECLKRSPSEAGLGAYQVRSWRGWHHPMALSLIATWFLVGEARRGKEGGPGMDRPAGADRAGADPAPGQPSRCTEPCGAGADTPVGAKRVGAVLPLQGT